MIPSDLEIGSLYQLPSKVFGIYLGEGIEEWEEDFDNGHPVEMVSVVTYKFLVANPIRVYYAWLSSVNDHRFRKIS